MRTRGLSFATFCAVGERASRFFICAFQIIICAPLSHGSRPFMSSKKHALTDPCFLEDHSRRKRGRPPKTPRAESTDQQPSITTPVQTPRMQSHSLPRQNATSPALASPPEKTTPNKAQVKALPTVRDHTSDQLNEEGDEYIPKEFDDAGEAKADAMGYPQGGREYKCRTFCVPNRGTKLFMLATECARVLNYRDSYLLFNKNRSLHKIIASQIEKDDLIRQDILPYSYRSRQIAIVSARSMFRQFGSRVIVNGRRVRDDYWESKARKQGFTEDDLAGEKRPGATKARDGAAAETASSNLLPTLPHNDVIYSSVIEPLPPGLSLNPDSTVSLASLPMIHLASSDDPRLHEYNSVSPSRQELTGQPYQDRTQSSSAAEIINQASHTADFNKILSSQRNYRQKGLDEFYTTPREAPVPTSQGQSGVDPGMSGSQQIQPSQMPAGMATPVHAQNMHPHQASMMAGQANYAQQAHQQGMGQSPVRGMHPGMQQHLMQQRSNPAMAAQSPYGYAAQQQQQQQMWGQPPPQPNQMPQYSPHGQQMPIAPQQGASPLHHGQQPHHPSQSPRNQQRPSVPQMPQQYQMHHPQAAQGQAMGNMGFPGGQQAGYNPAMARAMYQASQGQGGQQQAFMAGNPQQANYAMGMGGGGMPAGWPAGSPGQMPQQPGQPQQGQSGSPLGGWSGY